MTHDYTRRKGVASVDMLAPAGAPAWCRDAVAFWNANEKAETRANARVAREVEVSLPADLDEKQRHALAVDLGQMLVDRYRVAALVAVHAPDDRGDDRNHHTHILLSAREVGPDGLEGRAMPALDARQGAGAEALKELRAAVADKINEHLKAAGQAARVDHRSLKAQAEAAEAAGRLGEAMTLAREPTTHEGKTATAMRRRGEQPDRGAVNDAIKEANRVEFLALWQRLEQAEAEGRLMPTPDRHNPTAARAERAREARSTAAPAAGPAASEASPGRSTIGPVTPAAPGKPGRPAPARAPQVRSTVGSGPVKLTRAEGYGSDVLNKQVQAMEDSIKAGKAAAQAYLDGLDEAMKVIAQGYADRARLDEADCRALFQRLTVDEIARQRVQRAWEAQQAQDYAESRPTRRLDAVRKAERWVKHETARLAVLDAEKPSAWRVLDRRAWAERRRRQAERAEKAQKHEEKSLRGVTPEAMEHYASQVKDAEAVREQAERERRKRIALRVDAQADAQIVANALRAGTDALRDAPETGFTPTRKPMPSAPPSAPDSTMKPDRPRLR